MPTALTADPAVAARDAAAFFTALSDPTRVRIVQKLAAGEANVTEIATALRVEIVNTSHHLQMLTTGGVVTARKAGRFVYYALTDAEPDGTTISLKGPGVAAVIDLWLLPHGWCNWRCN